MPPALACRAGRTPLPGVRPACALKGHNGARGRRGAPTRLSPPCRRAQCGCSSVTRSYAVRTRSGSEPRWNTAISSSELARLTGWTYFDARQYNQARAYFTEALQLAKAIDEGPFMANVLAWSLVGSPSCRTRWSSASPCPVLGARLRRPVDGNRSAHGHLNQPLDLTAHGPGDPGDPARTSTRRLALPRTGEVSGNRPKRITGVHAVDRG
ncbi:hypothetical protein SM007_34330 [Streptomyces avermitilis]|nr:hypothetical protein SM007_34330 [Streptomyces avermitilis]